jgi:3-phosphoshikimate 1-carboxyvinyltransferase
VNIRFDPSGPLRGTLRPPADKSISHRAALLGAMGSRPLRIDNYLKAADTRSTREAVRALGAPVEAHFDGIVVCGNGLQGAHAVGRPIDVGNAGTLMRLLPGWLAGQQGRTFTLDGDASIRRRPVDRVIAPLTAMGARLRAAEDRYPPLVIDGAALQAADYTLPVASAQVKSCVLLAALVADGVSTVSEPVPSRDHTERMLLAAGVRIERDGTRLSLATVEELALDHVVVPGDPSSAAFFVAAAVLVAGSAITVQGMGCNWTRTGFFRILERMGANIAGELEPPDPGGPITASEPVGDLEVSAGSLTATTVSEAEVPLAIDELPLVAVLGCFADGQTVVSGAQELRVKESDRIATVVTGLRGLGAEIEATDDGFVVTGTGGLRGGTLQTHGDHRLAMAGAVAGLASVEGVDVVGMEAAAVSYPRFGDDLAGLLEA